QMEIELDPGAVKEFVVMVGVGNEETAARVREKYGRAGVVAKELAAIRALWEERLSNFKVTTPDPDFNRMVNIWNAYQCFLTFSWSRAASYIYVGLRDGLGYRDTVQDIQGVMHLAADTTAERLSAMLAGQKRDGSAVRLIPFHFAPGGEIDAERYPPRSDDALWLFPTVIRYLKESGDMAFLDRRLPYADGGEATVYEHLKKALEFPLSHLGPHGLVLGLEADWNDCLVLADTGETVFVSFQLYQGLVIFASLAERKNHTSDLAWAQAEREKLSGNLQRHAWQKDRFVRAFLNIDGVVMGAPGAEEGAVWLNPQSWSVISGAATGEQATLAMDLAGKELATEYGLMLCHPAFRKFGLPVIRAIVFLPGMKENAGIFSHTQGWAILAETMLGRGDRAFAYYRNTSPARMNDRADIRAMEPYVHGQFTHGKDSPHHGRSEVHWLTGTASTVQVAAVEGILGVRPEFDGLVIDPCIPSAWDGFRMERVFRGKKLSIAVENRTHAEKGVDHLVVNGETIKGNFIPITQLNDQNEVQVVMG
ncbi:MAG TPA: N,N'-diacetylchitobiose phosphorylase, partial [Spirochaetia bacterium]|nr:N,N'-diacetylchitobiose phosphorylase [Spirochaetia bacterium]